MTGTASPRRRALAKANLQVDRLYKKKEQLKTELFRVDSEIKRLESEIWDANQHPVKRRK